MNNTPRIGSLFSGVGGLDLAVERIFGAHTVWVSEIDPSASKVLAKRFGVPNLGDITQINWDDVPEIDILTGGFPCQDVSAAGLRAGMTHGTRSGLWAIMAEAIAALTPKVVVIENVRGLLSAQATDSDTRAIAQVLEDLAAIGYDARWITVPASAVGAPHRRERVFILATPAVSDSGDEGLQG